MRQTRLSVEEIKDCIEGRIVSGYPRCLLVNELGYIALSATPDTVEAQKILVALLDSRSEEDSWIAIRLLKRVQGNGVATPDTNMMVAVFESNPENVSI